MYLSASRLTKLLLACYILLFSNVFAAQIIQVQPLNFGKVIILDNSYPSSIRIEPSGTVRKHDSFIIKEEPKPALFYFSQLPPHTNFSVKIDENNDGITKFSEHGKATALFTISPFFSVANYRTDDSGEAEVYMGGVLQTSGNGQLYHDGTYYKEFRILINF